MTDDLLRRHDLAVWTALVGPDAETSTPPRPRNGSKRGGTAGDLDRPAAAPLASYDVWARARRLGDLPRA